MHHGHGLKKSVREVRFNSDASRFDLDLDLELIINAEHYTQI